VAHDAIRRFACFRRAAYDRQQEKRSIFICA
jgi:hypothetical protein